MELELPNTLPVFLIGFLGTILPIFAALCIAVQSNIKATVKRIILLGLLAVFAGSIVTTSVLAHANTNEVNERFSAQLEEKYHATSSRSFTDMKDRLSVSGEVSTTLTRDGVETDVFIKLVHDEERSKVKLLFTVFNEGSLYPAKQ